MPPAGVSVGPRRRTFETNPVILVGPHHRRRHQRQPQTISDLPVVLRLQGNKLWTRNIGFVWPASPSPTSTGSAAIGVANLRDTEMEAATPELEFVDVQTGRR